MLSERSSVAQSRTPAVCASDRTDATARQDSTQAWTSTGSKRNTLVASRKPRISPRRQRRRIVSVDNPTSSPTSRAVRSPSVRVGPCSENPSSERPAVADPLGMGARCDLPCRDRVEPVRLVAGPPDRARRRCRRLWRVEGTQAPSEGPLTPWPRSRQTKVQPRTGPNGRDPFHADLDNEHMTLMLKRWRTWMSPAARRGRKVATLPTHAEWVASQRAQCLPEPTSQASASRP